MLFNSFQFLAFFIVVWILFLALRGTPRKILLLVASYYFYMCWNARYIVVILGITLIDYAAGLLIERSEAARPRKLALGLSLFCNIGLLAVFKYFNFLSLSATGIFHWAGINRNTPLLNVLLPVGLSFHTFQAMSYTIDVYKRKAPAERSLLNYALYVAFFPQMVAGPIERPNQLLPQFHRDPELRLDRIRSGVEHALWGLFKKMVIADGVSGYVAMVYAAPRGFSGAELLVATLAFAIQIYCDFSGYSDIAVGIARIMGYELVINFAQPYFSRSLAEFWHRWHISLSTWFRDYVYIPLGGNRVKVPRYYLNLMITFLLSGLWHGANWTFVAWGGLHGALLVSSRMTAGLRAKARALLHLDSAPVVLSGLQRLSTLALVTLAWILFRAPDLGSAVYIFTHLLPLGHFDSFTLAAGGMPRANAPFILLFIAAMFLAEWWIMQRDSAPRFVQSSAARWCFLYACAYSVVFFGVFDHVDFIYFQF